MNSFASSSYIVSILLVYAFSPSISSSSSSLTISIFDTIRHPDPYKRLTHLATTSIARAKHIKNPQNAPNPTTTPLSPFSGAYSISLGFGTPPQIIPFVMDTGSSYTWFPCYGGTLTMPHEKIEDFLVGCSVFSSNQPAGLAGFGRGNSSFPSQLGLKKFSYCLISHKFDNTEKSSFLLMDAESDSGSKTENFSYTPMLKNPVGSENSALSDYYYVGLRKITVGGKKVEILHKDLSPDSNGDGGTIVDSGTTFTYMNQAVFDLVADAFSDQVKDYTSAEDVEAVTGLRPCFDVAGHVTVKMPELKLHFKGGAEMALPLENYFIAVSDGGKSFVCLTAVTDDTLLGPELVGGPSVILGNFLMQNFHVEFDLRNERFGFRQQYCS
ncbi:hypothetical protein MIMGU_mgv1a026671mg [Erythranthe guttata]|uniref:Peptidase A1 domain-containing protein n=1 Tax=Erythranthe guttata TaxID=4155 RepID=A0A022QHJ7_ERYGU|nr:hypothetical protein MIMGU_mgv1a026671mg [Erythranthe guttata]